MDAEKYSLGRQVKNFQILQKNFGGDYMKDPIKKVPMQETLILMQRLTKQRKELHYECKLFDNI